MKSSHMASFLVAFTILIFSVEASMSDFPTPSFTLANGTNTTSPSPKPPAPQPTKPTNNGTSPAPSPKPQPIVDFGPCRNVEAPSTSNCHKVRGKDGNKCVYCERAKDDKWSVTCSQETRVWYWEKRGYDCFTPSLSKGAIAAIVIATIVGVSLIGLLVSWKLQKPEGFWHRFKDGYHRARPGPPGDANYQNVEF